MNKEFNMVSFNAAMASAQGLLWVTLFGNGLAEKAKACGFEVPAKPDTAEKTSRLYGKRQAVRPMSDREIARILGL